MKKKRIDPEYKKQRLNSIDVLIEMHRIQIDSARLSIKALLEEKELLIRGDKKC